MPEQNLILGGVVAAVALGLLAVVFRPRSSAPTAQVPLCPNCGSRASVVPVVYGEPTRKMLHDAKTKKISLGGYRVHDDDPNFHCLDCEFRWLHGDPTPVLQGPRPR